MGDIHRILWGIFFTLFTTFWCCLRPDFPSHRDSKLRILSRKLNIIFWALICPEVVLYWAMRQWFEAGKVAKSFRDRGWTRRHGLFLLMGGFVLCDMDGQPTKILAYPHFRRLLNEGVIDFPHLTSSEIQERSNFHPAFALIAFLQAAWFITGCLSHVINTSLEGMSVVTQLEAMTATIVIANWCTFFFAWQKPLDARFHILIKPTANPSTHHDHCQPRDPETTVLEAFEREENLPRSQGTEHRFQLEFPQSQTTSIFKFIASFRITPHALFSTLYWLTTCIFSDLLELTPCKSASGGPSEFPDGTLNIPFFHVQNTMPQYMLLLPVTAIGTGTSIVLLFLPHPNWVSSPVVRVAVQFGLGSTIFGAFMLGSAILANVFYLLTFPLSPANYVHVCLTRLSNLFQRILLSDVLLVCPLTLILARVGFLAASVIDLRSTLGELFLVQSWVDYIPHFS